MNLDVIQRREWLRFGQVVGLLLPAAHGYTGLQVTPAMRRHVSSCRQVA
jgi:hypothetical protein